MLVKLDITWPKWTKQPVPVLYEIEHNAFALIGSAWGSLFTKYINDLDEGN